MVKIEGLGVAGVGPAFEYSEHNVPPGPDEMLLETITPTQRGNTLDPEVRNPALQGRGGVIDTISPPGTPTCGLPYLLTNIILGVMLRRL